MIIIHGKPYIILHIKGVEDNTSLVSHRKLLTSDLEKSRVKVNLDVTNRVRKYASGWI